MILLWGVPGDRPMAAVRQALRARGSETVFVDQHDILRTDIEIAVGARIEGHLRTESLDVDLAEVDAVYLRPYDIGRLPAVARAREQAAAYVRAATVDDILSSWADLTPASVVNRPSAMAANGSKPYQAALIRGFGFGVPDSVVTTDPAAVRAFRDAHEQVIYKSLSSIRSVVSRLGAKQAGRIADVVWCPTQFQEYVPGQDYRVHVVGNELFACRVSSDADDYRYASRDGHWIRIEPCALSVEVTARCLAMTRDMGLLVSGIDLRETPDGRWYCFEVNPSPGFTFFTEETRQPVAYCIAHLLASGERGSIAEPQAPSARFSQHAGTTDAAK